MHQNHGVLGTSQTTRFAKKPWISKHLLRMPVPVNEKKSTDKDHCQAAGRFPEGFCNSKKAQRQWIFLGC